MKKLKCIIILGLLSLACNNKKEVVLSEGIWLGKLDALDSEKLPFNFNLIQADNGYYRIEIYNAEEVIEVDEIELNKDSIRINLPVFEGFISGTFSKNQITGNFIKESVNRVVPFVAVYGNKNRFTADENPKTDVSGVWETTFSPNTMSTYMGKGIFKQDGSKVTGTFRTSTGDYRFLDGVVTGDSLKLSAFDGSHAYLFTAKATDTTIVGTFYSGNHFKEVFTGKRNERFELPHEDSLTYLKKGYEKLSFSFPDRMQNMISLEDKQFQGKVIVVQLMGTWCPNCLDETKFLVNFLNQPYSPDIKVIGLAFETAKSEEIAFNAIKRLKERIGVTYPILLAQYGTSDKIKAQEKLPMLDHVLSYPTTIFIDKKGKVRKIHTGFNGPATGETYISFKKEFADFIDLLESE